jgi:Dual-action HEIGH metallo-peptidase/Repeat of unknown function (DUF5648)
MKQNNFNLLSGWITLVFVFLLAACQKDVTTTTENVVEPTLDYIRFLGYRDSVIIDKGDHYLVAGDMMFKKKAGYDKNWHDTSKKEGIQLRQYGLSNYIADNIQANIKIAVQDPINNQNLVTATLNARDALNALGSKIQITFTNNNDQHITVKLSDESSVFASPGVATVPINGSPGGEIFINVGAANHQGVPLSRVVLHELGHTLGIKHTDWEGHEARNGLENGVQTFAMHILNTSSTTDPASIFNRLPTTNVLSAMDGVAIRFIYPTGGQQGSVPIFRYYRSSDNDHFYTPNFSELMGGSNSCANCGGYAYESVGFFAFTSPGPGRVEVFRLFNASNGQHHYTADSNEKNTLLSMRANRKPVWVLESPGFFAFPTNSGQGLPVFRFRGGPGNKHLFTKNILEGQQVGLTFEGTAFQAL